eukprot:365727-Chlamydomonas_euryale.AAC.8
MSPPRPTHSGHAGNRQTVWQQQRRPGTHGERSCADEVARLIRESRSACGVGVGGVGGGVGVGVGVGGGGGGSSFAFGCAASRSVLIILYKAGEHSLRSIAPLSTRRFYSPNPLARSEEDRRPAAGREVEGPPICMVLRGERTRRAFFSPAPRAASHTPRVIMSLPAPERFGSLASTACCNRSRVENFQHRRHHDNASVLCKRSMHAMRLQRSRRWTWDIHPPDGGCMARLTAMPRHAGHASWQMTGPGHLAP